MGFKYILFLFIGLSLSLSTLAEVKCKDGYTFDLKTGTCELDAKPMAASKTSTSSTKTTSTATSAPVTSLTSVKCRPNESFDPIRNRCLSNTVTAGSSLSTGSSLDKTEESKIEASTSFKTIRCASGEIYNSLKKVCIKSPLSKTEQSVNCRPGFVYSSKYKRCVDKRSIGASLRRCKKGFYFDKRKKICVQDKKNPKLAKCGEGLVYNSEKRSCYPIKNLRDYNQLRNNVDVSSIPKCRDGEYYNFFYKKCLKKNYRELHQNLMQRKIEWNKTTITSDKRSKLCSVGQVFNLKRKRCEIADKKNIDKCKIHEVFNKYRNQCVSKEKIIALIHKDNEKLKLERKTKDVISYRRPKKTIEDLLREEYLKKKRSPSSEENKVESVASEVSQKTVPIKKERPECISLKDKYNKFLEDFTNYQSVYSEKRSEYNSLKDIVKTEKNQFLTLANKCDTYVAQQKAMNRYRICVATMNSDQFDPKKYCKAESSTCERLGVSCESVSELDSSVCDKKKELLVSFVSKREKLNSLYKDIVPLVNEKLNFKQTRVEINNDFNKYGCSI